jgi:hypothetical protein
VPRRADHPAPHAVVELPRQGDDEKNRVVSQGSPRGQEDRRVGSQLRRFDKQPAPYQLSRWEGVSATWARDVRCGVCFTSGAGLTARDSTGSGRQLLRGVERVKQAHFFPHSAPAHSRRWPAR